MSKKMEVGKLRQLLLRLANGLSLRQISLDANLSRKTVAKYSKIINNHELLPEQLLALNNADLHTALYAKKRGAAKQTIPARQQFLLGQAAYYQTELARPGVTMQLLWQEYTASQKEPYGYASFCKILKTAFQAQKAVYHKRYQPGEVLMIDFAGDRLCYTDKETGERVSCVVFVSVLGYSNYTYAEVLPSASMPYLVRALNNNLRYIQGVPLVVLTDNMAQLVKKTDRYEPTFTEAAQGWANHNGTIFQTARVAHPRDKTPVEIHVKIVYQRIYATLRHREFNSYNELSEAVAQKLNVHNQTNFQKRTYSRYDQFVGEELACLQRLPDQEYKMQKYTQSKVQKNYHILLGEDKHFYSVPYTYVGKAVQVIYTTDIVEIYHQMIRIAIHPRQSGPYDYTTTGDHMPVSHQHYAQSQGYKGDDFLSIASGIGAHTQAYVERMLHSRKYEAHAYMGCLGLLRLGDQMHYGPARLENACRIGLQLERASYKTIETILKNEVDLQHPPEQNPAGPDGSHANLRGPEAF